ncbi:MAG: tail fiber domain-containing protein [Rhizobacter sp.]|nr:tail fiber domain-containing protein [Ferruginibacter sp.]
MKKILLIVLIIVCARFAHAQSVGIGTSSPNASAMLEINSANKGLLLPRVTDTSAVSTPAKGLVVYSINNNKLWYYDGLRWQQTGTGATGSDVIWTALNDTTAYTGKKYIGVNTDFDLIAPQANLQVEGSFLVHGKLNYSKTPPTPAQTYTMNNTAGLQYVSNTDSVFRILDPGGTGNYNNNMQGNTNYADITNGMGAKLSSNAADFGIAAGDTLWISGTLFPACRTDYMYRFTNTSVSPADMILNSSADNFIFRSNADGVNSKGFNFTITRLFNAQPVNQNQLVGPSMFFNSSNGAFSAGVEVNNYNKEGYAAIAMGRSVQATGNHSTVIGYSSKATKEYSAAIGYANNAIGYAAMAFGSNNTASGGASATLGNGNYASGGSSFATGVNTFASGASATSMGNNSRAAGDFALATGNTTSANGDAATSFGYYSVANGANAVAMGSAARASGVSAVAIGNQTDATGIHSFAAGNGSESAGNASFATGTSTLASGSSSTALGYSTKAHGYASTVVGMYNNPISATQTAITPTTPLFMIGNGDAFNILTNAMVVLKNGNVGIGTSQLPVTNLQIAGGTDADLTDNSGYLVVGNVNTTNLVMDNNEIMARSNGATTTLFLQNEGGALETGGAASKPGGGSWSATSDARLKQNIQRYEDGLQQLQKINPVYFNYNQQSGYDTSKQFIGVLAQELKEVAPYMVGTFKKDNTEYLNVDNTAMTYMLINAVKEQQKEIEELKALVKKLIGTNRSD